MVTVAGFTEKQNEAAEYFETHLDEWVKNPLLHRKYGIIRDGALVGVFDTAGAAGREAFSKYPERDFIVQHLVLPDEYVHFNYRSMVLEAAKAQNLSKSQTV